jgi:CelD/BcsL family acetyltransferase involved in cellulose biosynthesis
LETDDNYQYHQASNLSTRSVMTVFSFNPLHDDRWARFVDRHPRASIFHTVGWLEALRRTYRYEPVVLTTTPPGTDLSNGLLMCEVSSWLTGRRLISVPFSDHCDPLVETASESRQLFKHVQRLTDLRSLRYVELRPLGAEFSPESPFAISQTFAFHKLDLRPALTDLFGRLHKDAIQRKIRRAEREGLQQVDGQSDHLLKIFYRLLTLTRRRHRVPPPPISWFQHIRDSLGDHLNIRLAFKGCHPIAGIVTVCHKDTLFYKYGGSDAQHHSTGAVPFLFWTAIQNGKEAGCSAFDFGRSDIDNRGLIAFKQRWGASASVLTYFRYPARRGRADRPLAFQIGRRLIPLLPDAVLREVGSLLYRHTA